jgi:hypothetical protein
MRAYSVLRQPPLHQKRNNDQDDNRGRENVSTSTLVTIDTDPWVRANVFVFPEKEGGG